MKTLHLLAVVISVTLFGALGMSSEQTLIPSWIKNTAKWWSEGQVDDSDFTKGLEYLIQNNIVIIPPTNSTAIKENKIPLWVKNNAGWWADGKISDGEFVKGIQYLIGKGIINVSSNPVVNNTSQCDNISTPAEKETCLEQAQRDAKIKNAIASTVPYGIGPVTFYYVGSQVQPADGNKSIVTLHFMVQDNGSNQVTMSCQNQNSCNYVFSDGTRNIQFATNTLVYGSLTLVPKAPTFVDWTYYDTFDTQRNYTFDVNEQWGTGSIPIRINW